MPGGRGNTESPGWFQDCFGFKEGPYKETQARFDFAEDCILVSHANGARFHVGHFETPSLAELRSRLKAAPASHELGGAWFTNITGAAKTLHLDAKNAGAVFQVASQFNCLEMVEPGARPEDGVTRYYSDATQGPACALACPAGTVYRNYFVKGHGQAGEHQIDCLADVGDLLHNGKKKHWRMKNGYCLPDASGGIKRVSDSLAGDSRLSDDVRGALRVGVHWDTEVKGGSHRVCQVFCSALPVAYAKDVRSSDWAVFATQVLLASYEATLAIAALLASDRGERVLVFLTAVGGGAFGNRTQWIVQAIENALKVFANSPLDIRLVHFGSLPRGDYAKLEKVLPSRRAGAKPTAVGAAAPAAAQAAEVAAGESAGEASQVAAGESAGETDEAPEGHPEDASSAEDAADDAAAVSGADPSGSDGVVAGDTAASSEA